MKSRISRLCVTLGAVAVMSGAGATAASAYGLTSGGEGPGPGICVPPGTYVRDAAQEPGPARLRDMPPGQVVSAVCAPGRQPDQ
jgi:hypothetical protein